MSYISSDVIEEVLRRADIVEIIGKYCKLKKHGANYIARCPFHDDRTPSFSVSAVRQVFHCFGCNESGNVISFLIKHHASDFVETVRTLASTYNIHIPSYVAQEVSIEKTQKKKDLHGILSTVAEYYHHNILTNKTALQYLTARGVNEQSITRFNIGYAKGSGDLRKLFDDYKSNPLLLDSGLVIDNSRGERYDRFFDRIVFPIVSSDKIIGFGGRALGNKSDGYPKYLNSPETELFHKSEELYAFTFARKTISSKNCAIVVEGYLDVIMLFQYGIENVVATMGTAVTESHIKKLFRICDVIYFAFDGDVAGSKAAWRALEHSLPMINDIKQIKFLFFPDKHDPDSFIRHYGRDKFELELDAASSFSQFLFKTLCDGISINTEEGKAKLINLAKSFITQIKSAALQTLLKQHLARIVGLDPRVIENIFNNYVKTSFYRSNKSSRASLTVMPNPQYHTSSIMYTIITHPAWIINYKLPIHIDYTEDNVGIVGLIECIQENHCLQHESIDVDLYVNLLLEYFAYHAVLSKFDISKYSRTYFDQLSRYDNIRYTTEELIDVLDVIFKLKKSNKIIIPRINIKV